MVDPSTKPFYKSKRFWSFIGVVLVSLAGFLKEGDAKHALAAAIGAFGAYLQVDSSVSQ